MELCSIYLAPNFHLPNSQFCGVLRSLDTHPSGHVREVRLWERDPQNLGAETLISITSKINEMHGFGGCRVSHTGDRLLYGWNRLRTVQTRYSSPMRWTFILYCALASLLTPEEINVIPVLFNILRKDLLYECSLAPLALVEPRKNSFGASVPVKNRTTSLATLLRQKLMKMCHIGTSMLLSSGPEEHDCRVYGAWSRNKSNAV